MTDLWWIQNPKLGRSEAGQVTWRHQYDRFLPAKRGMSRKNPSFKGKLSWCNGMKRCETMWNAPCYYCEKKSYKCPPMSTEVQTHVEKSLRRCSGIDQWRPLIISPSLRVTRYLWVYCTSSLFHIATSPPRIDTTRTYCTSLSTRQL